MLEHILCHDDCDVDLINNVGRKTPLHLAVQSVHVDDPDRRLYTIKSLLEAGADKTYVPVILIDLMPVLLIILRIKDKNGDTAEALVHDPETAEVFRRAAVQDCIDVSDVVSGKPYAMFARSLTVTVPPDEDYDGSEGEE